MLSSTRADKTWINKFESFLQDVCKCHSKIVITGDFNFPRASWNLRENAIDGNENLLVKLLNDFFLEPLNITPTRGENILDLVITSVPE